LVLGFYLNSLFFFGAAIISTRILINDQNKLKKSPYLHYAYALSAAWLAFLLMLFTTIEPTPILSIWFCILILCTSILLKIKHALWLNCSALTIYWLFSVQSSSKTSIFIESAFALTIVLLIASVSQKIIYDLKAKLNITLKTDNLTGCIQPTAFRLELEKVVQLYQRYETPFSLICIKYKHYFNTENDLQIWLKELTHLYQSRLRKTDILCRFTAQKFMILLPSTNSKNAKILLSDLKTSTDAYEFSFKQALTEKMKHPVLHFSTETFNNNESLEDWFKNIQSR
jgi:diguanylate cyclase (GGDEF)-like protein